MGSVENRLITPSIANQRASDKTVTSRLIEPESFTWGMDRSDSGEKGRGYVQFFVYRVPNKNRERLLELLKGIVGRLKEHGTIASEFYQLHSTEAFQGFVTVAGTFAVLPNEELWMELDYYRDRPHRDEVMLSLGKDPGAGQLFRQLRPLVSEGYSIAMGEFDGLAV
jgi:hypothetical protein